MILFSYGIYADNSVFYVSPIGEKTASGSIDDPFRDLETVRNHIRNLREKGEKGKIKVFLRKGKYILKETLVLTPEDSNITFKAYKNEKPIISSAFEIKKWEKLSENKSEISEKAQNKIWYAKIKKGWLFHYLFVNGFRSERSKLVHTSWRNWAKDHSFEAPNKKGQIVHFKNKKNLKYLPSNGDAEMIAIAFQYGVMGNGVITDVNSTNGTLRWNSNQMNLRNSRDPYERGYCFANALCLIDKPGEWAVNSTEGIVYYWPKKGEEMNHVKVIVPTLNELVRLEGNDSKNKYVENVHFEGITFAYTDRLPENQWPDNWIYRQWENVDAMIYLSDTKKCSIKKCRLLNSGSYGITMHHYAQENRVEKCEIANTGSGGIFLEGYGPGTKDVNKRNIITRNYIHNHGLGNYWHSPCIQIYQSGENKVTYNLLQKSAYNGISMVGAYYNTLNDPIYFFPNTWKGQYRPWNQYGIRWQDFSKEKQDSVKKGLHPFNRTNIKPFLHARKNYVAYNIISEPHSILNEGGAIYAYCLGIRNSWIKNIVFKSQGMPSSSIFALDNVAEFTTIKDNVYWINGVILNGIGARKNERGNIISGNIRVNFKEKYKQKLSRDTEGKWYTNNKGRKPLDKLILEIKKRVFKRGGWPKNFTIGIPNKNEKINKWGENHLLPKKAHVTIEN